MITKQFIAGFTFGLSMSFISWIIGMILNGILEKTKYYKNISNLNFIKNKTLQKSIGMKYFKWIVKNTFFKVFNPKIKLDNKNNDLTTLRHEMTLSEISHIIGFIFVLIVAIYKSATSGLIFGLTMMIPNILMNLYPSLLQQENKRRIDKLLHRKTRIISNKI